MPPRPSPRIQATRKALEGKLGSGMLQPGERFLSARSIAQRYSVSYQTADRLLGELTSAGKLIRRSRSGTFVPGEMMHYRGVELVVPPRVKVSGTFARMLFEHLSLGLAELGMPVVVTCTREAAAVRADHLPVLWEVPRVRERCVRSGRRAVLVHESPRPQESHLFDAVTIDNLASGRLAADAMRRFLGRQPRVGVLCGPRHDARSAARCAGFLGVLRGAAVLHGGGWDASHGRRRAPAVERAKLRGLFCVNDRLAEGVRSWFRQRRRPLPFLVGFDNAPIAEAIDLTTLAVPWQEVAQEVRAMVLRRTHRPDAPPRRVELVPKLLIRRVDIAPLEARTPPSTSDRST